MFNSFQIAELSTRRQVSFSSLDRNVKKNYDDKVMQNYTPIKLEKFQTKTKKTPPPQNLSQNNALVKKSLNLPVVALSLSLLLTVGLTGFLFYRYQQSQVELSQAALDNTPLLLDKVNKLAVLPQDETPSIATISDKTQLPDQPFFNLAQNGDKLLVYANAKKALLYRPSENKIVEMGPINVNSEVSGVSTSNTSNLENQPLNEVASDSGVIRKDLPAPTVSSDEETEITTSITPTPTSFNTVPPAQE